MARRILLLGDALCSAVLVEALRARFDGEVVHVGAHVGITVEAGTSEPEIRRVLDDAGEVVIGHRTATANATYDTAAMDRFIHWITMRDIEPCMPVPAFDRDRFDLPYGKKARRAMRRNRGRR